MRSGILIAIRLTGSLVPKFHLGTRLQRQFYCRSRSVDTRLSQREMKFREEQEVFPNKIWERGEQVIVLGEEH
jgi:hypothetical protein